MEPAINMLTDGSHVDGAIQNNMNWWMELATTTYMNKWQQCGWRQPQLLYVYRWRAMSMEQATNMLADGSHVAGTSHNNVTRWSLVDGANHYHVDILIFRSRPSSVYN
jgi:hypothetical protein